MENTKFIINVSSLNSRSLLQVPSPKTGKTLAGVTSSLNDVVDCIGLCLGAEDKSDVAMAKLLEVAKKSDVAMDSGVIVKACHARGLQVFDKISGEMVAFDYEVAKADMASGSATPQRRIYDRIRKKIQRLNNKIEGVENADTAEPVDKVCNKLKGFTKKELRRVIKEAKALLEAK